MALTGKELVQIFGNVGTLTTPAALGEFVTTQNIANLNTSGSGVPTSPLTGAEVVEILGIRPDGYAAATGTTTTTGSIAALGSIALSTLTGKEQMQILSQGSTAPGATLRFVTTALVAG